MEDYRFKVDVLEGAFEGLTPRWSNLLKYNPSGSKPSVSVVYSYIVLIIIWISLEVLHPQPLKNCFLLVILFSLYFPSFNLLRMQTATVPY